MGGVETEGTRDVVSSGSWDVKFQEAIVVAFSSHGECFIAVWSECVAAVEVDEYHSSCSEWGYGGSIPVKLTIEFFISGEFVIVL